MIPQMHSVLACLARYNAMIRGPAQNCFGGDFGSIVADNRHELATLAQEFVELSGDPNTGDRGIRD